MNKSDERINHKFHAQKYVQIPKIKNKFDETPKRLSTAQPLQPGLKKSFNSTSSKQFTVGNKRSYDSQSIDADCKSSREQLNNDMNKRFRNSNSIVDKKRKPSLPIIPNRDPNQKSSTSSQKKVATAPPSPSYSSEYAGSSDESHRPRSQQNHKSRSPTSCSSSSIAHRTSSGIRITPNLGFPSTVRNMPSAKRKVSLIHSPQTQQQPQLTTSFAQLPRESNSDSQPNSISQSKPDSQSSPTWTRFQTQEQQLEIMKYWLDKYFKNNRFDPAVSDLTSGKPWNEIEGKLLSQFMPIFKRYLSDNYISPRSTEFYSLFFIALQDKHKMATENTISPSED